MKLNKPAARLGLSAVAAVLAASATFRAIDRARQDPRHGPMTSVLVLRKAVAAGQMIVKDGIESRTIPSRFAEPGALKDVKELVGVRARIPLTKGEQLIRSKLESESSRLGLAWTLPAGANAVTLRLSAEGAVGGHVLPGDRVTVWSCASRTSVATRLVRGARVVAVQDKVWDPDGAPASPFVQGAGNESFLVTLLLTADQSARAVGAAERGPLVLTLHSPLEAAPLGEGQHAP